MVQTVLNRIDPAQRATLVQLLRYGVAGGIITLLVAADNTPACAVYAAAGFRQLSHFVYATRQTPNRMRGARPGSRTHSPTPLPGPRERGLNF